MKNGFIRGQWFAYNEVLGFLNTIETKLVDKTDIYKAVFAMRPVSRDKK